MVEDDAVAGDKRELEGDGKKNTRGKMVSSISGGMQTCTKSPKQRVQKLENFRAKKGWKPNRENQKTVATTSGAAGRR